MITQLNLQFGKSPESDPEDIQVTPVTVFVGPNNSGKSKVLTEIYQFCCTGQTDSANVILKKIEFQGVSLEEAQLQVKTIVSSSQPGQKSYNAKYMLMLGPVGHPQMREQMQMREQILISSLQNPNDQAPSFCQHYLRFNTLVLDGKSRINLIDPQPAGDLQHPASNLPILFTDDKRRMEVRRIIHEAFGFYFVLDPTHLGQLRIRFSTIAPESHSLERGLHEEAVRFHSAAQPIEQSSDGVKAFTGIITAVIAGDPRILLIDEPEAFLHPSLSFKLGKEIAQASSSSNKRLFVSTHSASFVRGCIQSGAPVDIVRLTYRNGVPTARVLPNEDILKLMRNPLLRSTGVLNGLFYEFVIVTESDADRAFYEEINERLLKFKPDWGISNCLFINAQNKQTVQTIVRPLRELGIPVAGIVDIDILKEGGAVWSNLMQSAFVPAISHNPLSTTRAAIKQKLVDSGKDMKKHGGINILQGSDKEAANNLFDQLYEYGIFVVREGELESWLKPLSSIGHGPDWLVDLFHKSS